jgi:transmembrane sensor
MDSLERAAQWFATRRRGVMSIEETAAYEAWVAEPANARAMAEMDALWAGLDGIRNRLAPPPPPQPLRVSRLAMVAAVCLLSLGLGLISADGGNEFWTTLDWSSR